MKKAILIHGWPEKEEFFNEATPSPSNNQWLPWLQKQLGMQGITAQTPEMPDAYEPVYEKWKSTFEHLDCDEETILVGHSCGAGFIVRWLSENNIKVGNVFLVAPWLDPHKELKTGFFDFDIADISKQAQSVTIFYSLDDHDSIIQSVDTLKKHIDNVSRREFKDKGHFCISDLGSDQFPELLAEILSR